MCFKDLKEWIFEVLKCWWCFTASNGSDLISAGCILPICQSSGTFRMSLVLIHQHTLFVHLLSHCCLTHVTFSWGALNPVLPWAQLVLMCKFRLNPVLTKTAVLRDRMSQYFYLLSVDVSYNSDNLQTLTSWVTPTLNIKWPTTSLVWSVAKWEVHMLKIHNSCSARRDAGLSPAFVMPPSHFPACFAVSITRAKSS